METIRTPLQGTWNIIRFNWHYYVFTIIGILLLYWSLTILRESLHPWIYITITLVMLSTIVSLLASMYAYDLSGFYKMKWAPHYHGVRSILNIHAGFDETSHLIHQQYPDAALQVFDFYDPALHTEISIRRARKVYPTYAGTRSISTSTIPAKEDSADVVYCILSAHEIRDKQELTQFFIEIHRTMKEDSHLIVVEHLRDLPNFIAYNIGFFHFLPRRRWMTTFLQSGFRLQRESKVTPFISCFILTKNGTQS